MLDFLRMLPWLLNGIVFSAWGAIFLFAGYQWGKRRGLNEKPQAHKEELSQARYRLGLAVEHVESQEQTIATLRMALQQAVRAEGRLELVQRTGAGR